MPITKTATVSHVVIKLVVDMEAFKATATLRKLVDGDPVKDFDVVAEGPDFAALLTGSPDAGLSRGDDVTYATYNFAVSKGLVEGEVT